MASWKEERDRLVAQTLAFVQQVAAAQPAAASKLGLGQNTPSAAGGIVVDLNAQEAIELPRVAGLADVIDHPITDHVAHDTDVVRAPPAGNIVADLPKRPTQYAKVSERSDIAQRVAAFKARQTMLNREREAYYDSVQARIRSSLRNDTGSGRL